MAAIVLLLFAGLLPLAATQCFHLDGSPVAGVDIVPCNPTPGSVSMCCALNRAPLAAGALPNPASPPPDLCLANGLCQATAFDTEGTARGLFVRESCSRADWAGCLNNVCPGSAGGDVAMTACGTNNQTTQWCCGDNNAACCRAWPNHVDATTIPLNFAAVVPANASPSIGRFTVINPTATSAGSGFSAQTGANGAPTPLPTGTDAPGVNPGTPGDASTASEQAAGASGLSTQAIAGIAAGVVVVVVILVTIGCFTAESLYKKKNRILRAERRGSLKNKIRLGWDRDSPERAGQIA